MKCINKKCPCGLYRASYESNCKVYDISDFNCCQSFQPGIEKQKRLLTPMELFERGAIAIWDITEVGVWAIIHFNEKYITRSIGWCEVQWLHDNNFKWSSDRKTWNSFEIEE